MSIVFCPLSSGSKGNCLYLKTEKSTLLIDLGISYRQLQKRLSEIRAKVEDIDAIMITHEHMDHISGLKIFSDRRKVPILVNADTAKGIYRSLNMLLDFKIFTTNEEFVFQDVKIDPFTIQHDTLDPVGFVIKTKKHKIGICSDLGMATSLVKKKLTNCDLLYLEANHEVDYVYSSARPDLYKERVKDDAIVVVDSHLVKDLGDTHNWKLFKVPIINETKKQLGNVVFTSVVTLAITQKLTNVIDYKNMENFIKHWAPKGTADINLKALQLGRDLV